MAFGGLVGDCFGRGGNKDVRWIRKDVKCDSNQYMLDA
jgi:hypothetical protein